MTDEEAKKVLKLLLRELTVDDLSHDDNDFLSDMFREYSQEYRQVMRQAKRIANLDFATDEGVMDL